MSSSHSIRRAVRHALLAGTAVAAATTANAQAADDPIAEIAEVVVTGTRIPRANLTAPTAVTTIDAAVIQQSGLNNVADILRAVPSFGVSALSSSNSNFFTAGAGINTLQLRNLQEQRTLVLVNGRRYVSGVPGSSAVDFNTVPIELIERVEIITGGASAIYGSDALAGVINVILRKDFEGVEFGYQFGEATEGGNIENRVRFTAGGDFADGRGNAVVSASFSELRGLLARERDNTKVDDIALCLFTGEKADCQTPEEGFLSSFSESGRFFAPSLGTGAGSFSVDDNGDVVPFDLAAHGFNRQAFRRYTVPTDRYLVSSLFDYDLGAGVNAFVEASFAQTRTQSEIEPFPHNGLDDLGIGIPVDNPFVPQEIRDFVTAAGDTEVGYFRRTTELDQRGSSATRNTYRFLLGFDGQITDAWKWKTFYSFGRMDDAQQSTGQINVLNMREALNVTLDANGELVCANPSARAEGCVPINLFGRGSISPQAAEYVRALSSRQMFTQQDMFGADLSGELFELPAGPIGAALGVEWRRERAEDVPDALTQAGLNGGNAAPPTRGAYDVGEAFLELDVPLLRDLPLVHELSIGGAYRFSDYSTVDTTDAYTGRLSWSPVESLRFRVQYARAVRAPDINELFAPGGENFAPVADPCNGVTATTPGRVAQNCRSIPAIAARIAATGSFDLTQPEIQGTGGFTGHGNSDLNVETSDSLSIGLVFDKDLGTVGQTTLSIDYFDIEIDDLIDLVARQSAVDFCFDSDTFPNQFCSFLARDEDGGAAQLGELVEVNSTYINEGTLETQGVDVSLLWRWNVSDWIAAIPGQAALRLNYTHLLDFTETKFGVADDRVGETGYAEDKGQTALVYSTGPWSATWEWNYIGNSVPDNSSDLFNFSVGSYSVHDLQLSFDFGESGRLGNSVLQNTRIYLGLNNVLDEDAPVILSGVPGNVTGTDTDASVYDPIGRTWYAGLNTSF